MAGLKALFLKNHLKLAVAESVTCGQLQAQIGKISGASEFFLGGITAYSLDQKVRHLEVKRAPARRVDCVSEQVAIEMAKGACRLFGADIAVATTGYAEVPIRRTEGGRRMPAVPYIWWGLYDSTVAAVVYRGNPASARPATIRSGRIEFPGLSRVKVQTRAAHEVLRILEEYLRSVRK